MEFSLGPYAPAVEARLTTLESAGFPSRLWSRDDTLWGDDPELRAVVGNRLGWLESPAAMRRETGTLRAFAEELASAGFTNAVSEIVRDSCKIVQRGDDAVAVAATGKPG